MRASASARKPIKQATAAVNKNMHAGRRIGGKKGRKEKKTLDLTEIISYYAIGFMLYRIFFLLRAMMSAPPENQYNNADWLNQMQMQKPQLLAADYSKMKGIRSSSGRTFLKYSSSPWETKWTSSMDDFVKTNTVCSQISFDTDLIRTFFNATCTSTAQDNPDLHKNHQGWCKIDDAQAPLFFNVNSGKVSGAKPGPLRSTEFNPPLPVTVDQPESPVFSKLIYRDDDTGTVIYEYLEPLISRLRHPLDCCEHAYKIGANFKKPPPNCLYSTRLGVSRTQYIPPSHNEGFANTHFFDSSATHWSRFKSSLSYVTAVWKRHGIQFSHFHVYEGKASNDKFMGSVPEEQQPKMDYRIANPAERTDFVYEIVTQTKPDDYVIFKLALDDPEAELRVFNELLENRLNVLDHLDEFLYTIPIPANISADAMEYGPWYKRFIQLRQEGVRAHSYSDESTT